MFGKFREALDLLLKGIYDVSDDVNDVWDSVEDTRHRVKSMETWIELLADTKADEVADEFSKLLESHTKSGSKITNVTLKDLVHQAVINTKK